MKDKSRYAHSSHTPTLNNLKKKERKKKSTDEHCSQCFLAMLTSEPSEGIGSNSSLPQTAVPRTINCISSAAYSAFYKKTIPVLGPHDENKLGVYKSAPSRTNRCLSHFHLIAQGGCSGDEDGKEADRRKTW